MTTTTTVRWGILSTGFIAEAFVKDLVAHGFTISAVASRDQASADAFAAKYAIPTAHGSYEALAADPNVDIVYVATPHPFHASNAKLVLDGGKHVLVEKPFTLNASEAREVVEHAQQKGLLILEAMWTRWLPHILRIREIIAAGTIGDVRMIISDHTQSLSRDPEHRINNPALGGGALLDLGIYPVSFASDILGTPTSISAISSPTSTGVDRQTSMLFGYEGGKQALLATQLDVNGPNLAHVIGDNGRIDIDSVWYSPTTFRVYDNSGELLESFDHPIETRGMEYQAWEAERLLQAGLTASDILSPEETVSIMETLDEVRRQIGLKYPGE